MSDQPPAASDASGDPRGKQTFHIIALKVEEGLEQSRVLLLCISPAALASGWVAQERSTAVHRDPANAGRRFIPLLLGDCALPDTLRRSKVVDFREEFEVAFAEVLAPICLWFCGKNNALDSANVARLFGGETELRLVA